MHTHTHMYKRLVNVLLYALNYLVWVENINEFESIPRNFIMLGLTKIWAIAFISVWNPRIASIYFIYLFYPNIGTKHC